MRCFVAANTVRYSKGRIITYAGEKGIRKQERVNSLRC
nr:MAG TPA: hypothetical protein [Caudoviricetes sp.]DAU41374.1 MAG TPA: hypothetical protein [Bacteriophage sp.]